jgi:plasmid stabilization system protein ParE
MTTIHRLLDETFAGIEPTPEVLDLKEEIRANLEARAAELEATGVASDAAAQKAVRELGDIRELVGELPAAGAGSPWGPPATEVVRPKPAYVARVVLASAIAAVALLMVALGALDVLPLPGGLLVGLVGIAATAIGWIVGDSLARETTTNHPMPAGRAGGYYLATSLTVIGLGLAALVLAAEIPVWCTIFAGLGFVGGIALFAYLGATQTNRHKAWVLRHSEQYSEIGDRFSEDPASAARFGIYTVAIWIVAITVFLVLSFTVGWAWSWLALVGGLVTMFIVLARMLFPATKE